MVGHAERKARALARVHSTFERPAVFITHATGTAVRVNVRIHRKQSIEQQQVDDWTHAGAMAELVDRVIFDQVGLNTIRRAITGSTTSDTPLGADVVLRNSYLFYRAPNLPLEVFTLDAARPEREGFVAVEVSELGSNAAITLIAQIDASDPTWEGVLP